MASRQLRKLRKQQELLNLQNEAADKSDESEDEPVVARSRGNVFSGFAALGDAGDDEDDDDDETHQSDGEHATPQQTNEEHAEEPAEPVKKSKKKSNKKKKKKAKQADAPAPAQDERDSADEIDRVLKELQLEAQKPGNAATAGPSAAASGSTNGLNELLRVNFQHLKAMNEMRRLFGKAMDVAEVEERAQDNRQRTLPDNIDLETFLSARAAQPVRGRGPQANKSMFDTVLRTNPFIDGKKTWPRGTAQGLKMIRVTEGVQEEVEFAFAHDNAYDALEGSFFGLVQMYDPMQIVYFLHRYPYHVSSLIQVSKVARQDQNSALAADLIERALFTFGRASLSEFRRKLEKGQARISFAQPENRQFYLAGYNLIQKLVLKGTHRTALEWAKLFLSINHDDPYAMINFIPVLAIRAREAQWLINFCNSDFFPTDASSTVTSRTYARQTLPLAHLQLKDTPTAKLTLTTGIETLPWLYCALFSALNLDTPPSVWGIQPRDADEALHTQLYIHAAKDLWNTPQNIALLKDAAAAASKQHITAATQTPPAAVPQVSLATARFIYLDNTPALMASVPRGMLHNATPNFEFDPLPPAKQDNVFSSETQQLPWVVAERELEDAGGFPRGAGAGGAGGDEQGRLAALARLRAAFEREAGERERRHQEEGAGPAGEAVGVRGGGGGDGAAGEGVEGDGEGEREARYVDLPPPAPGLLNYLEYIMGPRRLQIVDEEDMFEAPTGMPGGWGGWDEEEVEEGHEDDWGADDFEGGVDDFEGGGEADL